MKNLFTGLKDFIVKIWTFVTTHFSLMRLAVVCFVFIMVFVDENSAVQQLEYNQKIQKLKKEIALYKQSIEEDKIRLNELHSNEENLEKFAREQYRMKKADEDLFIIK